MSSSTLVPVGNTPLLFAERGLVIPDGVALTKEVIDNALYTLRSLGDVTKWGETDLISNLMVLFPDTWGQYIDEFDYSESTRRTIYRVYNAFPTIESRRWDLRYSHYRAVAMDYLHDYERRWFLDWAEQARLGSDVLYALVSRYHKLRDGVNAMPRFDARGFATNIRAVLAILKKKNLLSEIPNEIVDSLLDGLRGYEKLVLGEIGNDD